jgi:YaiO family outer membrane protein
MTRRKSRAYPLMILLFLLAPSLSVAETGGELGKGVALVRSGEYSAAAVLLRGILETNPRDREARIWLARALSFAGDFTGGEREYREVLSAFPGDVEARLGLADVLAWQKRYRESVLVLSDLGKERPDDPEVWVRQGNVAFWGGNPEEAKKHFEKTLIFDPNNEEARRGLDLINAKAAREYRREGEAGASYLRISGGSPGSQVHVAIRDRSAAGWEYLGRIDYLHRFKEDEGRGTAGILRKWEGGGSLRVEGGISPNAEVFSRESVQAELAWPLGSRLVGYAGGKYANYSVADAWIAVAALEWYFPGSNAMYARYILTRSEFDSGAGSTDGTFTVKITHYVTDDDRIWIYLSRGTESYTTETVDQIGNISSNTLEMGGRIFPFPRWGIEGRVAWQDRERDHDYFTVSAVLFRRF